MKKLLNLVYICAAVLLCGCGTQSIKTIKPTQATQRAYTVRGKKYYPLKTSKGYRAVGIASWYGNKFHGKKTASGERYNMHALSAAHTTLPMGTWVTVKNLENQNTVNVKINDRGPFVGNRLIDLSYRAARELGFSEKGTAKVLVVASRHKSYTGARRKKRVTKGLFFVQLASFKKLDNAKRAMKELSWKVNPVKITYDANRNLYRVRTGFYYSREKAERARLVAAKNGYRDSFIITK